MVIIKPGFTPGFRGRGQAPAWNRRAHYLVIQEDCNSEPSIEKVEPPQGETKNTSPEQSRLRTLRGEG